MAKVGRKKNAKRLIVSTLVIVGLPMISFALYSATYYKKVYARQQIGDILVSGLSQADLRSLIEKKSADTGAQDLVLAYKDGDTTKNYTIKPSELGLHYNIDQTTEAVWRVGREGSLGKEILSQLKTIFVPAKPSAVFSYNQGMMNDKLASIAKETDSPEKDFALIYKAGKFSLSTDRQDGKRIDQEAIKSELSVNLSAFKSPSLSFSAIPFKPGIDENKAKSRLEEAKNILAAGDLLVTYDKQQYKLDTDTIGGMVESRQNGDDLEIFLDTDRIKTFVASVAASIDVDPQNAKLQVTDGRAAVFQASAPGRVVNRDQAVEDIKEALISRVSGALPASLPQTVALVVADKNPEISEQNIDNLGITELVTAGTTDFKGSPSNRVHNIQVGAAAINGVLVKPGDTFSTLAQLGKIDDKAGYLPELVIKDNSTVPEFGGGLCQVSTTLFRATMNAGMKITERQNHSYRVSYYEPPIGMDATIYDPAPDFQFINNYANNILIQSKVVGTKITFEIYGTKDSRQIQIGDPQTWDPVDPGSPIMVETDTLAPGEKKQTDHAHAGVSAKFHYKVVRDGATLQETDFVSKYVPWPEKWLVGKQPTPAAETPAPTDQPAAQ